VRNPQFALKVPAGTGSKVEARLAKASPSDLANFKWYTVKSRDTLTTIARKLKVSRADLAEANGLSITSRVRPGQELIIPRAPTTLLATHVERAAPAEATTRAANRPTPTTYTRPATQVVYKVKPGDTLSSIAKTFDTTVASIKTWNKLHSNVI